MMYPKWVLAVFSMLCLTASSFALGDQSKTNPPKRPAATELRTLELTPVLHTLLVYPTPPKATKKNIAQKVAKARPVTYTSAKSSGNKGGCGSLSGKEYILCRESGGGNVQARNGQHFGMGQLNDNARRAQAKKLGVNPNTTDASEQSKMMDGYVADRYGSYEKAEAHSRQVGWY